MKFTRVVTAVLVSLAVLVATACGGSSEQSVPADAVAVVDGTPITKKALDVLLERAKKTYASQKRTFPKAGTADYQNLQTQAVAYLVQRAEYDNRGAEMKLTVTDKEVTDRITQVKTQSFGGSQAKLDEQLKAQGYTMETLRADITSQLLTEKIYDAVTSDAKVTDAEITKYYNDNKSQFALPESRDVRHILVQGKAQADKIYSDLKGGADFTALAKQYSIDPGSKDNGGKLTITKGQTVEAFDKTAFLLAKDTLSRPGQDAIRLPPDRTSVSDQAGRYDTPEGCPAADQGAVARQGEVRPHHAVDRGHQEILREQDHVRDGIRSAGGCDTGDLHLGDDHRLTRAAGRCGSAGRRPRRAAGSDETTSPGLPLGQGADCANDRPAHG